MAANAGLLVLGLKVHCGGCSWGGSPLCARASLAICCPIATQESRRAPLGRGLNPYTRSRVTGWPRGGGAGGPPWMSG
eukprot:1717931-Heterocapsa_arctica.AAC.1